MVGLALLCLMFLSEQGATKDNWDNGRGDSTYGNLGFYMLYMTCNNEGNTCKNRVTAFADGHYYPHILEYRSNPYTLHLSMGRSSWQWRTTFTQDDPSGPFRACYDENAIRAPGFEKITEAHVCVDNAFSGVSVPGDCSEPLLVVSLSAAVSIDELIHGQQILYCLPNPA